MYAVFGINRDESNLQPITDALSLLLFINPSEFDVKLSSGSYKSKKLSSLFRALSYETSNESLALFKLPLNYRNSDVLDVISQISGYTGLVQERIEKLDYTEIKQQLDIYCDARFIRYHFRDKRDYLQPVFFSLLANSPFPLTQEERDAFSTWGHRTLEEERQLAEQFYQRIYSTHVASTRKYLKTNVGSEYIDPLLAPLQWHSSEDARAESDVFTEFFATSAANI